MKNILMIGPSRDMQGGIVSVVDSYYSIGINEKVNIKYISTIDNSVGFKKLAYFIKSLILILSVIKKFEVVHIHMASSGSFVRKSIVVLLTKCNRKKVIIHMHGGGFMDFYEHKCNKFMRKYINKIFNISDIIIALSEKWKINLSQIVSSDKIVVINNGVISNKNNKKKEYDKKKIVFLGRLVQEKGIYDILDVIPEILERHTDAKFIIGGNGEINKVKEICKSKGISQYVDILGWVEGKRKEKVLEEATIFILPSYNEGMPISILEAMSYSVPIIASNVGGIEDIITNNKEGLIISPGNKNELRNSLIKLLDNNRTMQEYGKNAKEKMEAKFNLENIVNKLIEIYEEI